MGTPPASAARLAAAAQGGHPSPAPADSARAATAAAVGAERSAEQAARPAGRLALTRRQVDARPGESPAREVQPARQVRRLQRERNLADP